MKSVHVLTALMTMVFAGSVQAGDDGPIDVQSERQLFVDRLLIKELDGARLAHLAGKAVRLRFVMHDADLFAFCFAP